MTLSKIVQKADKQLTKERELTHSRAFPHLKLQILVDRHFTQEKVNGILQITESRDYWDVTFVRNRVIVKYPSEVLPWLAHYNPLWGQLGFGGLMNLSTLYGMYELLEMQR